ncbi:MAG: hypothetical protein ACE5OQ_13175, partial [Woeseia sp.]
MRNEAIARRRRGGIHEWWNIMLKQRLGLFLTSILLSAGTLNAQDLSGQVAELRQLLEEMKNDYESRISALENRLDRAQRAAQDAARDADQAMEIAEQTAIDLTAGASAPNTFNPAIGGVQVARFADVDPGWEEIPGFMPGGELGPGGSGFSLGESDFNINANIDPRFFGNLTLALEDQDGETEIAVEEAWIQTTGLSNGLTLRGGRYFSGIGYLNKFHRHADDFADRPLPYQAFLGGQYIPDGIQLRWIAPTTMLLELGAELDWSSNFPSSASGGSSANTVSLFAKIGGDLGTSHSWQLGLSHLAADVGERGTGTEIFSGDSDLSGLDFVWKWAPEGNPTVRNFKTQGEYFRRDENGDFAGIPYAGDQDGWYLQGV